MRKEAAWCGKPLLKAKWMERTTGGNGEKNMEQQIRQKRIIVCFFAFLGFMWICTLVSKSIYASGLPQVTVKAPEKKSLQYTVKAEGTVSQGSEVAIHTEEGLRVEKIFVREGDAIEADTVLFRIDKEDLKEKRKEKELAIAKLKYEMEDFKTNRELAEKEKEEQIKRAKEDYGEAQSKAAGEERAADALGAAEEKLNRHLENGVSVTPEEERQKAESSYQNWRSQEDSLTGSVQEKEQAAREAVRAADETGIKAQQANDRLTAAEGTEGEAAGKVSAAEKRVREAEKNIEDAAASGGTPEDGLQQALLDAQALLAAAQTEYGTAQEQTAAARTEAEALQAELATANQALLNAQTEYNTAEEALKNWQANPVAKPDYSSEDSAKQSWESSREALKEGVKSAQHAKEDAQISAGELLKQAERGVEDAMSPKKADSTLQIYRLELEQLEAELAKYRALEKADGNVTGGITGTVTGVRLTAGERTPDGAAVVCADSSQPYRFEAILTKEQKKYVNLGDTVTVSPGKGKKLELTVDYLEEEENSPGNYRVVVNLPEKTGQPGMSGVLSKSEYSDSYDCCILADALYSENNGTRFYVYVAGEREGILGKELYAKKCVVKLLEQNEEYAALVPGTVSMEDMVIIGSDKELTGNEVIRYSE